jgi:hypothetical protein
MPRDGKNAALSKKVWQYDYSDMPCTWTFRWYQFNIPQYAAFIDILVQKFKPQFLRTFTRR